MGEQADLIVDAWFDRMWGDDEVLEDFEAFRRDPADNPRVTRALKHKAHLAFDRIWKTGRMTRSAAYRWLARELGVPASEAHMAVIDQHATLERVIEVSDRYMGTPLAADDFPDD